MTTTEVKESVRQRDGACVRCGVSAEEYRKSQISKGSRVEKLDVHRKIPNGSYSLENCVTLCRCCHTLERRCYVLPEGEPGSTKTKLEMYAIDGYSTDEDIINLRRTMGMSQNQFAQLFGVTEAAVSRWESGYRRPNWDTLKRLNEMANELNKPKPRKLAGAK